MKRANWFIGVAGLLLVILSIWQIRTASQGLEITRMVSSNTPITIIAPISARGESRPLVLVGHGFAGSGILMRGFSLTLAHAGYVVVSWDFDGHASNTQPFPNAFGNEALIENAENALSIADVRGLVTNDQVAILGHSMGSGVALSFSQKRTETAATIAVSPVYHTVTPTIPHNLLLMAGSLEESFIHNAERLLSEAGGPGGDHSTGTARDLRIIPGVEHISILFSPASHMAAREWLDATFGPQPNSVTYTDRRMLWYGLGLIGVFLTTLAISPVVDDPSLGDVLPLRPLWIRLSAPVGGALGATLVLWILGKFGLDLRHLLGVLVGGYLIIWYGLAGLISLVLLRIKPSLPSRRDLSGGLLASTALWLGVGLLGHFVWLPWLLIPQRLLLVPVSVLIVLPWFLAIGEALHGEGYLARLCGWLWHSVVFAGGIVLVHRLIPELSFLLLILPLVPIIIGLVELVTARLRGSWPFAISGALYMSWMILAVLPIL
jgi:pimeloyl-ACP methyl ester carboxylesterase